MTDSATRGKFRVGDAQRLGVHLKLGVPEFAKGNEVHVARQHPMGTASVATGGHARLRTQIMGVADPWFFGPHDRAESNADKGQ